MDAAGKVAVVAGGGSGMGRASAELLAKRGAKVAILDLPGGKGAEVAAALGDVATFHPCDIISSRTPAGVAMGSATARYLKAGDVVDVEIDGLGRQRQHTRQA